MSNIIAIGSIAYDSVETWAGKRSHVLGGSATYFSVAASLFSSVSIVAVVGTDFTDKDFKTFDKKGIDRSGIEIANGKTFHWEGLYPTNGDAHTLRTELNVFENFNPKIKDEHKDIPIVFLGNIDPEIQYSVLKQITKPKWVVCDTMNFWIEKKRDTLLKVINKIDLLVINETEVKLLSHRGHIIDAVREILSWGPQAVVVKNGARGADLFYKDKHFVMPACPVNRVTDPTGAGDTFAGGFVGYLAKIFSQDNEITFKTLKRAAVYGNIMASFTIEDFGLDKLSNVSDNMLNTRFKQFQDFVSF